jgi:hypothetical protein
VRRKRGITRAGLSVAVFHLRRASRALVTPEGGDRAIALTVT